MLKHTNSPAIVCFSIDELHPQPAQSNQKISEMHDRYMQLHDLLLERGTQEYLQHSVYEVRTLSKIKQINIWKYINQTIDISLNLI